MMMKMMMVMVIMRITGQRGQFTDLLRFMTSQHSDNGDSRLCSWAPWPGSWPLDMCSPGAPGGWTEAGDWMEPESRQMMRREFRGKQGDL